MFFVFSLLLLSVYASETNHFVLKKYSQGNASNGKENDQALSFQDVQNYSSVLPERKPVLNVTQNLTKSKISDQELNNFSRKLSDDIPIKRHIQDEANDEEYLPPMYKSTANSIASPKLESKRKWPVVELLSNSDDSVENPQYFEDFEKKELSFFRDVVNKSKSREFPPKSIASYLDLRKNLSKDKPVDLRSLSQFKCAGLDCEGHNQCQCSPSKAGKAPPGVHIKCTRSEVDALSPTAATKAPRLPGSQEIDMGFPMGIAMGVPMGIPAGYLGGYLPGYPGGYPPVYPAGYPVPIPANIPPATQEVPKQKKPRKKPSEDYLYYDDDVDEDDDDDDDDDDDYDRVHHCKGKKRKPKDDVLFNRKPKRPDNPDGLATDIFNDIKKYSDTIIKNCYCYTSSSSGAKLQIVFLFLLIFTVY